MRFLAGMLDKRLRGMQIILFATFVVLSIVVPAATVHAAPSSSDPCVISKHYKFLGIIPTWYEYIGDYQTIPRPKDANGNPIESQVYTDSCGIVHPDGSDTANNLKSDAVAIGLAVIDILLRVGALVAVAMIMMGGYKYMSSQGEPKNLEAAMATIINAAIGLGIVLASTVLVAFIGHTLGG